MTDLHRGILEEFAEAQTRFAVWTRPLARQSTNTLQALAYSARGNTRPNYRCTMCGRRGHSARSCINQDEWNA